MFVIVVGGGKTGSHLASELLAQGYQVKVVEDRPQVVARLREELPESAVHTGDGSSPSGLEAAGIAEAQVLAAVTGEDDVNLVVTTLARFEFNVPRVIARVNNPKNAWLFTKEMGVDVAINQADLLAKLIAEEMSLGDMMTLLKLRRGEYSIVEEKVHPQSVCVGQKVMDIDLPHECVLAAIIRGGKLIVPRGTTVLEAADEVLAVVHASATPKLAVLLGRPPGT